MDTTSTRTSTTQKTAHTPGCVSGNKGPEWSGSETKDGSGWTCDECGSFISAEAPNE